MFKTWNISIDGTPCEGKLSRTVWSGGKAGEDIKGLPIAIWIKVTRYETSGMFIEVAKLF